MLIAALSVALTALVGFCSAPRTSFEAKAWARSAWISAKDAPVKLRDAAGRVVEPASRAADGTSWFATSVVNRRKVVKAEWMTCALGTYELYVNGRIVGNDFLKPGYTHVRKTRRSFSYDITGAIDVSEKAENFFAAEVSSGWWRDKIVNFAGRRSAFRGVLVFSFEALPTSAQAGCHGRKGLRKSTRRQRHNHDRS